MTANKPGWRSEKLGDIAKVTTGGTPSRNVPDYWNGDVPWITTSLVDFNLIEEAEEFLTLEGVANSSAKVFPRGTVLMAMFGQGVTRGKVAILGIDAAFNQACVGIVPGEVADGEYLYQFLAQNYDAIRQLSNSGSQENLNAGLIKGIDVVLPPLPEQRTIAAILSTWDRGIRLLGNLITTKVRFKQRLIQEILTGRRRFTEPSSDPASAAPSRTMFNLGRSATAVEVSRGLNGKSYDEGIPRLGDCPQGWNTWRLKDLLTVVQRPVSLQPDASYRLVTAKRYRAGIVHREVLRGDQIKTKTQFQAKAGDFLISRRQIVHGACGLVPAELDGALVSNEYSCLSVCGGLDALFLEYLTNTRYFQQTFYQSSVGVTVEKMIFRIDHWLNYEIHLPPVSEQRRVVSLLCAVDSEIVLLDQSQKLFLKQKRSLMQKLLTGEVRVKLSEEVA